MLDRQGLQSAVPVSDGVPVPLRSQRCWAAEPALVASGGGVCVAESGRVALLESHVVAMECMFLPGPAVPTPVGRSASPSEVQVLQELGDAGPQHTALALGHMGLAWPGQL